MLCMLEYCGINFMRLNLNLTWGKKGFKYFYLVDYNRVEVRYIFYVKYACDVCCVIIVNLTGKTNKRCDVCAL